MVQVVQNILRYIGFSTVELGADLSTMFRVPEGSMGIPSVIRLPVPFGMLLLNLLSIARSNADISATETCHLGYVPSALSNGSCECGLYPGINCFSWNGKEDHCWNLGYTCGDISALVGSNLTYNSFGTGILAGVFLLAKDNINQLKEREGVLLTRCKGSKTVSLFDGVTCVDCSSPNPVGAVLLYLLLNSIPIVVLFAIVVFFNINLASGLGHSFLFFYQIVPLIIIPYGLTFSQRELSLRTAAFIWRHFSLSGPIFELFDTHALPCFSTGQTLFAIYSMNYLKIGILIMAFLVAWLLVSCQTCPTQRCGLAWSKMRRKTRHFREKYVPKGTIIIGLSSAFVVLYTGTLYTSFYLLAKSTVYYFPAVSNGAQILPTDRHQISVPLFDGNIKYFSTDHAPFGVLALFMLIVVGVLPPLLLLYKPIVPFIVHKLSGKSLPTLSRLDPVFDVFQGVFKTKYQYFAGLYLFYRFILWAVYTLVLNATLTQLYSLLILICILSIHCFIQPFEKRWLNYIETLFLLNITMIAALMQARDTFQKFISGGTTVDTLQYQSFAILSTILLLLPIVILAISGIYKLVKFVKERSSQSTDILQEDSKCDSMIIVNRQNVDYSDFKNP